MPEISRFLGIVILMYFNEHNPPHFHIRYNEYRATMDIKNLNIIAGSLPATAERQVRKWAAMHQEEMLNMWNTKEFHKIKPLV